jgi:hypothetical protein
VSGGEVVSLDLSVEELTALAQLTGISAFPGVGDVSMGRSAAEEQAALRTARRSLLSRGLATVRDGTVRLSPAVESTLRITLWPELFVTATRQRPEGAEVRLYFAQPELAVGHSVVIGAIHRLTTFPPGELLQGVVDFLEIVPRPASDRPAFELPLAWLGRILQGTAMPGDGFPPEGQDFLRSLAGFVGSSRVTCLHGRGPIRGGELRWMDLGDGGLWLIEPIYRSPQAGTSESTDLLALRPITGEWLLEELLRYLPPAA